MADRPETLIQHLAEETHDRHAVVPPIYQTSLFVYDDVETFRKSFQSDEPDLHTYSRVSNPTLDVAEKKIAALEGTDRCRLFSSGMAAISAAIMSCVRSGSHVVCVDTVYGPTRIFLTDYLPRFGVTVTFVDGRDPADFERATTEATTLYYLESPSSVLFRLQDLAAVAAIAKARGISTVCDNSWASPVYQQPARLGIDIVVHSATKYLGGHSDVVAGALCTDSKRFNTLLDAEISLFGGTLPPFPAWLVLRGLRTLPVRLRAVGETATTVAKYLQTRPEVEEVFYVGLPDYPQADLRDKQLNGVTGLVTFMPAAQDEAKVVAFVEKLRLFQIGVSWGGHESLAVPLQQQPMDWPESRWLVRLYCGLEHPDDLIADLDNALGCLG
ncbi:MAG: aminotransferase class I/II-fold pyridoxal phosphate-dependent enzyme [Fimbriimonadaceae bacterium]|nr:aminotransferase class I/II-fold pyridoxal phosphate-dependent enzyme [Fimbriimonadaceae bacterium]